MPKSSILDFGIDGNAVVSYYVFIMKRVYESVLREHFAQNRQMVFVSGPRQVGKTSLAESVLPGATLLNYDNQSHARIIAGGPERVAEFADLANPVKSSRGIVFDELHKFPKWKGLLKGFFDVHGKGLKVVVTGSARLDIYKRGGDSLMGRYFPFRIHPLGIGEIDGEDMDSEGFLRKPGKPSLETLDLLLRFGGFPEPFLKGNARFRNQWNRTRLERLFHEDIRDLSRVQDIIGIRSLASLVASRVCGGVNYAAMASDLAVAPDTAKAWLGILESVYFSYSITPWFRNVANSIRKQHKAYLWDWSSLPEGGARNENFIASHLMKAVHWWTDTGLGDFSLHYLRDKNGREVDFVVARDGEPYMLVECKSSMKEPLSSTLEEMRRRLSVKYAFQIGLDGECTEINPFDYEDRAIKVSALDFLKMLV